MPRRSRCSTRLRRSPARSTTRCLLAQILNNQATIVMRDDPARALALLTELERLARELGDEDTLSGCVGNQGYVLARLGNPDAALKKFQQQEHLARAIGDMDGLQNALSGRELVLGIAQ